MNIRPFRPADTDSLYDVCLRTVDAGRDGSHLYPSYPRLPGDLWLGAYLELEPSYAFVLEDESGHAIGYTVGAVDSERFFNWTEERWWPRLRALYPDSSGIPADERTPEQRLLHIVHHPVPPPAEILGEYPSHLHIDILPSGQAHGYGRRMLDALFSALATDGSQGVYLGVPAANVHGIGFYEHLGFVRLPTVSGSVVRMGLSLEARGREDA